MYEWKYGNMHKETVLLAFCGQEKNEIANAMALKSPPGPKKSTKK
jgi:hypothetical protein